MVIAAGVIIAWPSTAASIPAGWTRVTALDGQYLREIPNGSTNPGTTGGAATHTHGVTSHTHSIDHAHASGTSASVGTSDRATGAASAAGVHTHTAAHGTTTTSAPTSSAAPTTDSESNELDRLDVIWIQSNGSPTQIPAGALTFWPTAEVPSGWSLYVDSQGRYLRGAAAAGNGGGTDPGSASHSHVANHNHTTTHSHTSVTSGAASSSTTLGATDEVSAAVAGHTHPVTLSSTAPGGTTSNDAIAQTKERVPEYYKLGAIAPAVSTALLNGTIAAWLGTLASIPAGWFLCDGNNGTPNLLGTRLLRGADSTAVIGETGGDATHNHVGQTHTHSTAGTHTHTRSFGSQSATTLVRNLAGASPHALTHSSSHNNTSAAGTMGTTGGTAPTVSSTDNMPPFTQVAFIQFQGNREIAGSGGLVYEGEATQEFSFGSPGQVPSDIVVEWDFDNDGDFSDPGEDITQYVMSLSTRIGRDWPSLLQGKATPGILRATLNDKDGRFSYFNANSPLNQNGNSLKTGRKLRVRTTAAGNPDPTLLVRDRFNRLAFADGTETGQLYTQPLTQFTTTENKYASVFTETTTPAIAVVDAGVADYYAQVKLHRVGRPTSNYEAPYLGLVYRYQDSDDYSRAILDVGLATVRLQNIVAGVLTNVAAYPVEIYDDMTIGVLVSGSTVDLYVEGVKAATATAIQTDETRVGLFVIRGVAQDGSPYMAATDNTSLDDFHVWSGLTGHNVEGILWTGDVSNVFPGVVPGPFKTARLEGIGVLNRAAGPEVLPPRTVTGRKTGLLVGNTLAMCNLLHPPCPVEIQEGLVTTGPFGLPRSNAIDVLRLFEEVELGFLHEEQEGHIGFHQRDARDGAVPLVTFSDSPIGGYTYREFELSDWKREIVNRVVAGLTSLGNFTVTRVTRSDTIFNSGNNFTVIMPTTVNEGDLLIIAAVAETGVGAQQEEWNDLSGWEELTRKPTAGQSQQAWDDSRIYVKIADGDEDSTTLTLATTTEAVQTGSGAAHVYRVENWYGEMGGIEFAQRRGSSNPPLLTPPWGLEPTLFIAFRWGMEGSGVSVASVEPPIGYTDGTSTTATSANSVNTVQSARKIDIVEEEDPGLFQSTFTGFGTRDSGVIAIRGIRRTDEVIVDDLASQDEHREVRTHRNASKLFKDEADAETYGNLVLSQFATDRPIIAISFFASKNAAYRLQAIRRRVSDMIHVVGTSNAGMGIDGDFFIEAITHEWSHGTHLWRTTWELSPAA